MSEIDLQSASVLYCVRLSVKIQTSAADPYGVSGETSAVNIIYCAVLCQGLSAHTDCLRKVVIYRNLLL